MTFTTDDTIEAAACRFFGLTRLPFGAPADPSEIFCPDSRAALIGWIVARMLDGQATIAVSGERGVGKTSLLPALADALRAGGLLVARLDGAAHTPTEVHGIIGQAAGIPADDLREPQRLLGSLTAEGKLDRLVVLVDDAQSVPAATFRYLNLLAALFRLAAGRLRLVLFGHRGDWPGLAEPDLERLRTATLARETLQPLYDEEAAAYLGHKLLLAGGSLDRIITGATLAALLEDAGGIPARLDALAWRVLVQSYRDRREPPAPEFPGDPDNPLHGQVDDGHIRTPLWATVMPAAVGLLTVALVAGGIVVLLRGGGPEDDLNQPAPAPVAALAPPAIVASSPEPAPSASRRALAMPAETPQPAPPPVPAKPVPDTAMAAAPAAPLPPQPEQPVRPQSSSVASASPPASPMTGATAVSGLPQSPIPANRPVPAPAVASTPPATAPANPAPDHALADAIARARGGHGAPGLAITAGPGDDLATLYARVYRHVALPPPYVAVVAANPVPIRTGSIVIFPEPPGGWSAR